MFLQYDIRGKYPQEINISVAKFLTERFSKFIKNKNWFEVFIAQDQRKSSNLLVNAYYEKFLELKIKVNYLGILPTPIFYYYCLKYKKPGIIITASHLPESYNGFKFFLPNNNIWIYKKIPKNLLFQKYQNIFLKEKIKKEIYLNYLKELKKYINLKKNHYFWYHQNIKSSNKLLLKLLPKIFPEIKLSSKKAEILISSDYDGDRIFFKYKNKNISPEHILFIILKTSNYKKVGLPITIHKRIKNFFQNIKFYLIKTGHINFKKAYKKYNLDFALEPSYHFYFFKELKTEAPILALLKFFKFQEENEIDDILKIKFPSKRLEIKNEKIIKEIENYAKINKFKIKKFDDYYFFKNIDKKNYLAINIRKSKTESNIYRIFIEANNFQLIRNFLNKLIKK